MLILLTHNIKNEYMIVQNLICPTKDFRPFRRPRHRWEDGIRIDLREIGWGM
jgi:hypothetical protein